MKGPVFIGIALACLALLFWRLYPSMASSSQPLSEGKTITTTSSPKQEAADMQNGATRRINASYAKFKLNTKYISQHSGWRPLRSFDLVSDCMDAMNITRSQFEHVKEAVEHLKIEAGRINGTIAIAADKQESGPYAGQYVLYIPAISEKWASLKSRFETDLKNILGSEGFDYFNQAISHEMLTLTGDFGNVPRVISIDPTEDRKAGEFAFVATIDAGGPVMHYADAFPAIRSELQNAKGNTWTTMFGFNEPPVFLKDIVEFQ